MCDDVIVCNDTVLQVLEPSMLEAQLSSAVKNYVLHTVVLHPESRTVSP